MTGKGKKPPFGGGRNHQGGNRNAGNDQRQNSRTEPQNARNFPPTAQSSSRGRGGNARARLTEQKRDHPIASAEIEQIWQKLERREMLPGGSDLVKTIQEKSAAMGMRFNQLAQWAPEAQQKFLRVLVDTLSASESEFAQLKQGLLIKALESNLIDYFADNRISAVAVEADKRTEQYALLVDYFVQLLCLSFEILPTKMSRHLKSVKSVLSDLSEDSLGNFLRPSTVENLKRLKTLKDACSHRVVQEQDAKETAQKEKRGDFVGNLGPPPEDFRQLSVQPTVQDLLAFRDEVYLRAAKKLGKYDDNEHYLDVQFRLMREDLIRPLREGIADFRKGGARQTDLYVYHSVRLEQQKLHQQTGELLIYARIDMGRRRIRWTKKLMYGSLVCLSPDDFREQFLLASVVDRDGLEKGDCVVGLRFDAESLANEQLIERMQTAEFRMAESPAFFEAYKHVMMALQSFRRGEPLPFSRYLVQVETDPERPLYIRNSAHAQWNFAAFTKTERSCQLARFGDEFNPMAFQMDLSQFEAIKYALNSELAIIQGPPGTGKTFIGLKIAEFLLKNQRVWDPNAGLARVEVAYVRGQMVRREVHEGNRPMLVVCYTNHALDQFLEGIARFQEKGIVRIGGRCKNPNIEKYTLSALRKDSGVRVGTAIWREICKSRDERNELVKKLETANKAMDNLQCPRNSFIPLPWTFEMEALELHDQIVPNFRALLDASTMGYRPPELFFWLTGYHPPQISFAYIRALIAEGNRLGMGVSELEAKRAFYVFYFSQPQNRVPDVSKKYDFSRETNWIFEMRNLHPKDVEGQRYLRVADAVIGAWPQFRDIILLERQGIPEPIAVAFLRQTRANAQRVLNQLGPILLKMGGGRRGQGGGGALIELMGGGAIYIPDGENGRNEEAGQDEEMPMMDEDYSDAEQDARMLVDDFLQLDIGNKKGNEQGDKKSWKVGAMCYAPFEGLWYRAKITALFHKTKSCRVKFEDYEETAVVPLNELDPDAAEEEEEDNNSFVRKSTKKRWEDLVGLNDFARFINAAEPMPEETAKALTNLEQLPLVQRWSLYRLWIQKAVGNVSAQIKKDQEEYGTVIRRLVELQSFEDLEIMRNAKVVAMTTTGAAKHQGALRALRPRIVVVEEAAEVLEAHILTSLTEACEHLILIGDHKQLRPNPAVYELARKYNLEISLFERLINNDYPYRQLRKQHRMRPEISRTLMPHFYKELEDADSVHDYPDVNGVAKNMFFLNHSQPESGQSETKSHRNEFEAKFVVRLALYFVQQEYKADQITILTTYLDQFLYIREAVGRTFNGMEQRVRVETVDNYQGEECDIIILSMVRSNNPDNKIGYLNTANRVCVALSRAKMGFFVVGNFDFLAANCQSSLWRDIRASVQQAGCFGSALPIKCQNHGFEQLVSSAEELNEKSPEGGCMEPCNTRMDCGHTCPRPCHAMDAEHKAMPCTKPCARTCPAGHLCQKQCNQPCGICPEKVMKQLPCGHQKQDKCGLEPEKIRCVERCSKLLPCLHPCTNRCSLKCTEKCFETVKAQLPCGHTISVKCYQRKDLSAIKCTAKVTKEWPGCGHKVENVECHIDVQNAPCRAPCGTVRSECGHLCKGTCGECRNGRLHIECAEDCRRILVCGHECRAKCSRVCPPCERPCETACGHSKCCQTMGGEEYKRLKLRKDPNQKQGKKGGRTCGEPCPPCAEPCLNRCEHRQCDRPCWMPCSVEPCSEPCGKLLQCSPKPLPKGVEGPLERPHHCVGVCGEVCPEVCRICNPERFTGEPEAINEVFFGTEDDDDARFVQLKDCGHFIEVTALDHWVREKSGEDKQQPGDSEEAGDGAAAEAVEILQIPCPKCKAVIRRSRRYVSLLNKRALDIQQVKIRLRGSTMKQLEAEANAFLSSIYPTFEEVFCATLYASISLLGSDRKWKLQDIFGRNSKLATPFAYIQPRDWSVQLLSCVKNIANLALDLGRAFSEVCDTQKRVWHMISFGGCPAPLWSELSAHFAEIRKTVGVSMGNPTSAANNPASVFAKGSSQTLFHSVLVDEFLALFERLRLDRIRGTDAVSEHSLEQLSAEIARFRFLHSFFRWLDGVMNLKKPIDAKGVELCVKLIRGVCGPKEFSGEHKAGLETTMEALVKHIPLSGFAVSKEELIQINKALGGHITRYAKCRNGHLFGIGDCGMAMTTSQCPECRETIGGGDHQLLATNTYAEAEVNEGLEVPAHIRNPFQVHYGGEW